MREFGSEHPSVLLPDGYLENLGRFGHVIWLRSGREGLLFVANGIKKVVSPVILFPAYCCWSMSAPFYKAGWRVVYYKLNEDLSVDLDYLGQLMRVHNPEAVLTMNFYGSARTDAAIDLVKKYNGECICVEDFSHCTFSFEAIFNQNVDFYVSSVRKSVGVTDGAIVIGKTIIDTGAVSHEETPFSENRKSAQFSKFEYSFTQAQGSKESYLSVLREEEIRLDGFDRVHAVSQSGRMMMNAVNGAEIRFARSANMKHAIELMRGHVSMLPGIERCLCGAPFSLPILVDDRDEVQKHLARYGVYAPVLWPICDEARSVCGNSVFVSDHMLSIPIDQRYNWDDIEDICKIVISTVV